MGFAGDELSCDAFLGGRVNLWQPRRGFRSGLDAVLLASAVPALAGEQLLELGLGAGAASLCLAARVPGVLLTGVERQPEYAELARRNAGAGGIALDVVLGDVADLPGEVRARVFDHVFANPPYHASQDRSPAADPGREAAFAGADLAAWVGAGLRRLRPGGTLTLIVPAARLPVVLGALPSGGTRVQPLAPRPERDAERVIVRHRKGSRSAFRLLPHLVLHAPEGPAFLPWAENVLRNAAPMPGD